ncbi:MAG: DNA-binding transcriptional regulator [Thermoguttaceae bacterium]|jgi:LacI family transcriptional regulator|nr:DNA-binding transcriptional regulator [Thermoguttaceae bacterium]
MPRVALLIETSREYGRGLLRGIAWYLRRHGPWSVYFHPMGLDDPPPPWLKTWQGDGILARINNDRMARAVLASGLPAVDLRGALTGLELPHIGPDNRMVVGHALDHLIDRGFRHFAFYGAPAGQFRFLDLRRALFQDLVAQSSYKCSIFGEQYKPGRRESWERRQQRIAVWLQNLSKPVGLMCSSDEEALDVLDACRRAELAVPDQVAVVSVDNDEYICLFARPTLTSVDVNLEEIGCQAAALLDRMMAGEKPPEAAVRVPPRSVVARRSTEAWALPDEQIGAVVRYIRDHACEGIDVDSLLEHCTLSRRTLERRFKELMGRTLNAEILRVRLESARRALARTQLPVTKVAVNSGFHSIS